MNNSIFSFIKDHLENYIDATNVYIYCKDKNGKYLSLNQACVNIFKNCSSYISDSNIIGNTDFDFFDLSFSEEFKEHDDKVISTESPIFFSERNKYFDETLPRYYMSHKMPLRSRSGKVIGILGQTIEHEQSDLKLITTILHDIKSVPVSMSGFDFMKRFKAKYQLTNRQAECAYHLVKGKTKKEISQILNLSIRTVETYWEQIKNKLNCNSRSHLIDMLHEES